MVTILAVVLSFTNIMNVIVGLCCMLLCVLVFAIVTSVNIKVERFVFVVIVMNVANCFVFYKVGNFKWRDCLEISGIGLLYTIHFIHRLGLMVDGKRLDVTTRDYIYAGLINFMDVPYFIIGVLSYVVPIADWTELNQEVPLEQKAARTQTPATESKNAAQSKKEK